MSRLLAALVAAMVLAACSGSSSDSDASPSTSTSTSPSTSTSTSTSSSASVTASVAASGDAPTAEQVTWAGQVCSAASRLRTSIREVATAATQGDGDAQARLSQEVAAARTSATTLADTVAAVPSSDRDDPDLVAVRTSSEQLRASVDGLQTAVNDLQGTSGADRVRALAAVRDAADASLRALGDTTRGIGTAAQNITGTLGQAFAANSSCTSLTP